MSAQNVGSANQGAKGPVNGRGASKRTQARGKNQTQKGNAMLEVDLGHLNEENMAFNADFFGNQEQGNNQTGPGQHSNAVTNPQGPQGNAEGMPHQPQMLPGQNMPVVAPSAAFDPQRMQQMPHQLGQHGHVQMGEDNTEAIILTRVSAELSLGTSREYMIAQTTAMRMREVYMSRIQAMNQELANLQHILSSQNPHLQNGQGVPNMQMMAQNMGQHGMQRRPEMQGFGMNVGEVAMNGMAQPQMESLKMEPGAKRKAPGSQASSKKSRSGGPSRWTKEQDEQLRQAVEKFDGRNWKAIAELVPGRDHVQCLQRWKKVLRPGLVKGHWSPEEDQLLLQLIQDEKMHSWAMVASKIKGRTAKQCRERWSLNLDPGINRSPWTPEEDALLLQLHEKMGGKWSEIKTEFDGRTENAVKTRFKSLIRAKAREWTQEQDRKLIQLRMKYGKNWAAIKKEMPDRSRNAIKVRCKTLEYDNNVNV